MSSELREALFEIIDLIGKWRNDGAMEQWQYQQLFDIADNTISSCFAIVLDAMKLCENTRNCQTGG